MPVLLREMTESELPKLADIDRSEIIRVGFAVHDGALVEKDVNWDDSGFIKEGDGEHTVAQQIAFCRGHLAAGAAMIGAFDGDALVGIGLITPEVRPGLAQLAFLHVSARYRRKGIASSIAQRLLDAARQSGADRVYVSATPTQSAVRFYQSLGFTLAAEPLPELYALEPEDIHMILNGP